MRVCVCSTSLCRTDYNECYREGKRGMTVLINQSQLNQVGQNRENWNFSMHLKIIIHFEQSLVTLKGEMKKKV